MRKRGKAEKFSEYFLQEKDAVIGIVMEIGIFLQSYIDNIGMAVNPNFSATMKSDKNFNVGQH
jgi:hypothetical protein